MSDDGVELVSMAHPIGPPFDWDAQPPLLRMARASLLYASIPVFGRKSSPEEMAKFRSALLRLANDAVQYCYDHHQMTEYQARCARMELEAELG